METTEKLTRKELKAVLMEKVSAASSLKELMEVVKTQTIRELTGDEYAGLYERYNRYYEPRRHWNRYVLLDGALGYRQFIQTLQEKVIQFLKEMTTFEQRWDFQKKCVHGDICFARAKIANSAMELSLEIADFNQAQKVWNAAKSAPLGLKAIQQMASQAKTTEEHWQVALLAKNRLPEVWKKSIKFLAKKL